MKRSVLLLCLLLGACATSSPVPVEQTTTATSAPATATQFQTNARFGKPVMSPRGIEITASKAEIFDPEDTSQVPDEATPIKLTLTIMNASTQPLPLRLDTIMTSNGIRAPRLVKETDKLPVLRPGEVWSTELAFAVIDPKELSLTAKILDDTQPIQVNFVGAALVDQD